MKIVALTYASEIQFIYASLHPVSAPVREVSDILKCHSLCRWHGARQEKAATARDSPGSVLVWQP